MRDYSTQANKFRQNTPKYSNGRKGAIFFTTAVIISDFNDWHKEIKKKLNGKIEYLREEKERIDKELQESLEKLAIYD